ncbi:15129_t:CDS:2, partial [Gigaspora rosea]
MITLEEQITTLKEYLEHIVDNVSAKKEQALEAKNALSYFGKLRKQQINNFWKSRDNKCQASEKQIFSVHKNIENIQAFGINIAQNNNGKLELSSQTLLEHPFPSYKKFFQMENLFGLNIERIGDIGLNNLIDLIEDITQFENDINLTVEHIKKRLKAYGIIENCTNEAEKSEFIGAILLGDISTFEAETNMKCKQRRRILNMDCSKLFQLQAACQRKRNEPEYVYRVVTTGEKSGFTIVTTGNQIGAINKPIMIHLSNSNIKNDMLKKDI